MAKPAIRLALISVLFVAAVTSSLAQSPAGNPQGYPAAGQPTTVTVLSPGAMPRTALRYTIAKDYKARMDMNMKMGMAMSMAGMGEQSVDMPAMKLGADVTVTSVTPAGDVSFDFAYTSVSLDAAAGADPTFASLVQGMDADFKNVRGSQSVTNRGASRGLKMDVSKVTNPQVSQMLSSLSASLDNAIIPLPEEAVGPGARWESRQTIQSTGIQMFQKTLWELVSIDGKAVTLKATTEQTAPPQAMNNPAMPAGAVASLDKFTGRGTGTITLRLDALVPTSEINSHTDMAMSVNAGGTTQQINVGVTMKLTIAPGK